MADQRAFNLSPSNEQSMVQFRVRPNGAETAFQALERSGDDPACHRLGPETWLLTSEIKSATNIIEFLDNALSEQLYAATDMSSALTCFSLTGSAARSLLAMGCGLDMHESAFEEGMCTRTYFAGVALFIVAAGKNDFNLYIDRSLERYLSEWIDAAGKDPIVKKEQK